MKKLILFLCVSVSFSAWAGNIALEVVDEGQNLKVTIDSIVSKVQLEIPSGTALDARPLHYGTKDYILVVLQYADHDSGTSVLYALDGKGKKLWRKDLQSFNPSTPLIEKDYIYMSTIGKVWKLNKISGKVVWKHYGLYKTMKFNGAESINRKGKMISFSKNIEINDLTGAIVDVKK